MKIKDLKNKLFGTRTKTYCVLDGAAIKDLPRQLYDFDPLHECLIRGELTPDMVHVAPYVALMIADDEFSKWVLENALGKNAVIFINTRFSMNEMRNHLRALMTVFDENGNPMLFRYYDPRVFRKFLPMCDAEQVETFFGNIDKFFVETDDGDGLAAYTHAGGKLEIHDLNEELKEQ